jgi:hypothetical protein
MKVLTIGRSSQNNIVLNDPLISRHHAQLAQHYNGVITITDMGSRNGTKVNGYRIVSETTLRPGDQVRLGDTMLPWERYFSSSKNNNNVGWWIAAIIGIILLFVLLGRSCERTPDDGNLFTKLFENIQSNNRFSNNIKVPTTVDVQAGVSLKEAGRNVYFDLLDWEERYGLGGIKLLAEASADQQGEARSSFGSPTAITFYPPEDLHFTKVNVYPGSPNIIARIVNGDISVQTGNVKYGGGSGWFASPTHFEVIITITNRTGGTIWVSVPQGQMIEVQAPNVQNIVTTTTVEIEIYAYQTVTITVKAWCANEKRGDPISKPTKLTPFVLNAPVYVFNSQNELWYFQRENRPRR